MKRFTTLTLLLSLVIALTAVGCGEKKDTVKADVTVASEVGGGGRVIAAESVPEKKPAASEGLAAKRAEIDGYIKIFDDFFGDYYKEVLPNGMTVIVKERHTSPVAFVLTHVKTGSAHEQAYFGAGVSHFNEHLLFRSMAEFKDNDGNIIFPAINGKEEFSKLVEDLGGWDNAATSHDYTQYIMKVLAENVHKGIQLQAHMLMHADYSETDVAEELEAVLNERSRNLDDPGRVSFYKYYELMYTQHPYKYPVIGYLDAIKAVSHEQLRDYYKSRYVPDNMVHVVVGDVDTEEIMKTIRDTWIGSDPANPHFRRTFQYRYDVPREPEQNIYREEIYEHRAASEINLQMGFHSMRGTHPDMYPLDVLANILGGGANSRLHKRLVVDERIAERAGSYNFTRSFEGQFTVYAGLRPGTDIYSIRDIILEEIEKFKTEPITKEEILDSIKANFAFYMKHFEDSWKVSEQLAEGEAMYGDPASIGEYYRNILNVKPDDVMRVAREYLVTSNLCMSVQCPPGTIKKTDRAEVAEGTMAGKPEMITLDNGLRIVVEENHNMPSIYIAACGKGGLRYETPENNGVFILMGALLSRGTEKFSFADISRISGDTGISIGSRGGKNTFGVSASMISGDWMLGTEMFKEALFHPTFPKEHYDLILSMMARGAAASRQQPKSLAGIKLNEAIFNEHPYSLSEIGSPESLQKLTIEEVKNYHNTFVVPSNLVISVVGDITKEQVISRFTELFGDMPAGQIPEKELKQKRVIGQETEIIDMPGAQQTAVYLGFPGVKSFDGDEEAISAMRIILHTRVFANIRGKRNLAYDAGVSSRAGFDPGVIFFYADTRNYADYEKVLDGYFEEIKRIREQPVGEDELRRLKIRVIAGRAQQLEEVSGIAETHSLNGIYDRSFEDAAGWAERMQKVTAEDIMRVAKKLLNGNSRIVIVGPQPKEGE